MDTANSGIDAYFSKERPWQAEAVKLRAIILDCPLTEDFKWYTPCYTYQKSNVVLIGRFKDYIAVTFFKGALLTDTQGILAKPGANTQAARLIRFTGVPQIAEMAATLKAYIHEAIALEKAGLKVDFKDSKDLVYPQELQDKLDALPAFRLAFDALTPGRRRAYNLHFTAAKQSGTRTARIEKSLPKILAGKGLND